MAVFHFWSPARWSGKSSMWERLPNSGDLLELLIPNYIRKAISGWTNHSCKVTSQKAYENNVEYRGSKSDFFFNQINVLKKISFPGQRAFSTSTCLRFPERVYKNVDKEKLKILKENQNKSGIYMWKNLINGKKYVGSSENLKIRFLQYFNTWRARQDRICMYILGENIIILQPLLGFILDLFLGSQMQNQALSY